MQSKGLTSSPTADHPRPVPMPGRLPVTFRDWDLRLNVDTTLDQTKTDTRVTATGTVVTVNYLDRSALGRVMLVLADENGDSAHVTLAPDVTRQSAPVLAKGVRLTVRGLTVRPHANQPAGIECFGVEVA